MTRFAEKIARIRAGNYKPRDFIIADAKDGDMGPSIPSCGPKLDKECSFSRYRTRPEFLDNIRAVIQQDIIDIMLVSASNLECLTETGAFAGSSVKPAIRANDATDIWVGRGATYSKKPSRPYRTASLSVKRRHTDLGLYSITFNNDLDADYNSLLALLDFIRDADDNGFNYFLEVFNPNVDTGIAADLQPHYVNDCIIRALAGLTRAQRPQFLKIPFNGPKALEELASYDPSLIVGVLGGGAGTARDTFELIHQAEKYGARVALFGRKINLAEDPLAMIQFMRAVADGDLAPEEACKAYHGALQSAGQKPLRPLDTDIIITEKVLMGA
ncbi:MAG: barrel motif-containing protein [Rhizobium sp.]|nr:barrel motif-containing protein [Rhizobium sp.]